MKTKATFIICAISLLSIISANAQQGNSEIPPINERINRVIQKIEKKITITENQKSEITTAFTQFFEKADAEIKSGKRPDKEVMHNLELERDNKIKKVLSEKQYEEYLRISCQLRPHPDRKGERPPERN